VFFGRGSSQVDDPVVELSRGFGHPAVVGDESPDFISELSGCGEMNGIQRAKPGR
jgi:hypothetical protein